jgi:transcription termination factor Rho
MNIGELEALSLTDLRAKSKQLEIQGATRLKKEDLILRLMQAEAERKGLELRGGVLEVMNEGMGFLRAEHYLPGPNDIYVSQSQIRRFALRTGDMGFDLETDRHALANRLLNLVAPIGRGQRGLIVSPPKAGKTTVLKGIANAISQNYPQVHLMVALIGERPEEVTDMDRSVDAEVIASTFDDPGTSHVRVAEMALERAKRLVECDRDVVILLDSITRLARAYNLMVTPSGRTLSGGLDPAALYPPKRFFGAARNLEDHASLTIIATCLVDTGSRMDDVVYEEFKGTGNMELHLSRRLQERRVFPAFDIDRSSTRREELLLGPDITQRVWLMRRMYSQLVTAPPNGAGMEMVKATEAIIDRVRRTDTNVEFLESLTEEGP